MTERDSTGVEPRRSVHEERMAYLASARGELADATRRGEGGGHALRQYSHRMDAMVQQLFAAAGPLAQPVGIYALGGYGRRQLCLYSDIDLLVLFAGRIGSPDERFLHAFLNPLWDLGLTVGHHVREVSDGAELGTDNPEFLLALTDARTLAGDATLLERFLAIGDSARTAIKTVDALKGLVAERHARFNDTFYQLEPDVKEAPGGLRDLFAARTIARLSDPAILSHGGPGARTIDDAEEFLLRVRSVLHLEAGRQQNVMAHERQEQVAARLGYQGTTPHQSVERLMGDYFRHARVADRALRWALKAAPSPVGPNLVRGAEGIRFVDLQAAAERPETWLSLFQAAIDAGCSVSDETLIGLQLHVGRFQAEAFFPTPASREALFRFLRPVPGLYARLSEMHDIGLLGQMLPEFKAITCRVVRDFYHKYTVDEHTLLTIRNLERLAESSDRGRFCRLLSELESPELLVLSLLYHDIGKSRDEDHATESVRLAQAMFARLGLDEDARETVDFLVRQHLQMSVVAFRRDTEDPEIVRQFAGLVGTEERLKMLCLMTLADVEAVSRETLTPWREELLWRLYVDTYNHLTLAYGDEVIDRSPSAFVAEVIGARPDDVTASEVESFLEGLPRRYVRLFSRDAIYTHVRLARELTHGGMKARLERTEGEWELTVLTRDQPFLFSKISGLLSSFGMDILRGFAFTKPDGLVVDMFHFADEGRFLTLNEEGDAELLHALDEVVSGRLDIATRLRRREEGIFRQQLPAFAPVIHCDNESSRRYTIMEVGAENALGLLYRISRAISESGCDVELVLINTEGRRAIDVFHLSRSGAKLTTGEQQALIANMQRVLEGRP